MRTEVLRLMAVTAHPDDETLGCGGVLARYADEGVETYVVTATRGQAGRHGEGERPPPEVVGEIREAELRKAAAVLGVREVTVLDYMDGALDQADSRRLVGDVVAVLRRIRPQVVVTFSHDGAYGHPDHIAISQATSAALVAAASSEVQGHDPPHEVMKLYQMAWGRAKWDAYQAAFKTLTAQVDGEVRQANPWPEWAITTRVDARAWWPVVWDAVRCHESQMSIYQRLDSLSPQQHETLWGDQTYYRASSTVNGGRETETDLFEGIR